MNPDPTQLDEYQQPDPADDATLPDGEHEPRRGFFVQAAAAVIGAVVGLVPLAAGLVFFLDPLIRRKKGGGGGDGFIRVTTTDALPDDGTPQEFKVLRDEVDAWNTRLNEPVGTVYLRKTDTGLAAFNRTCPHLGCTVNFRPGQNDYFCPCHLSAFALDGERKNEIPPRPLDSLEVEVRNGNEVWVRFLKFRGATPNKIPVA